MASSSLQGLRLLIAARLAFTRCVCGFGILAPLLRSVPRTYLYTRGLQVSRKRGVNGLFFDLAVLK